MENAMPVGFGQSSERYIISVQERRPEIIILHVQAFAAAGRHLIDKAEYAFVPAPFDVQGGKRQAKRIVGLFANREGSQFALARAER